MKNTYKILITFISVLAVSCNADDVDNRPVVTAIAAPELTAPLSGKSYILDENNALKVAETFVWSAAEYDQNVVVNYSLVMDKKEGDFSAPIVLGTTSNATEITVTVKTLNQAAIELGAIPDQTAQFDIKVISDVSKGLPMTSEMPVTITVTPYTGRLTYDFVDWYFVGSATVSGWDNNKGNQPLFRSGTNPKEYKYTGFFTKGEFKVISNLGSWIPMLGKASATTMAPRNTDADADPANFVIAADGFYTFTMNTETLAYTLVAYDASTAKTYPTVGIIGDSTPNSWDASTPLTKSTFDGHMWSLGVTSLKDGGAKFRANNAWDVSWGGATAFSGGGSGDNIPVQKSKYLIYFNDLDGSYLLIPNQE
jgi:hypothetical protein